MRKLTFLLTCLFLVGVGLVNAQSKSVFGKVFSADDGQPIIGATVKVKGTSQGTVTNTDGEFRITLQGSAKDLVISYVGMKTVEAEAKSSMVIQLQSDSKLIDEVVVVAYGVQSNKKVASSISSVKGDVIKDAASTSLDQALQGRSSGVQVTSPAGVVGQPPIVRIRGVNSITSGTSPLYVVDGIPISTGNLGLIGQANGLADINPSDIVSMDVLKDAAAAAMYGSRGANGVILITTKSGSRDRVKVNYDAWFGYSSPTNFMDVMNAQQYVDYKNAAVKNAYGTDAYDLTNNKVLTDGRKAFNLMKDAAGNVISSKWRDAIFQNGFTQNHTVSASGGNDKSQFFVSTNYVDQKGMVIGDAYNRLGVKANANVNATNYLKLGVNLNATSSENKAVDAARSGSNFAIGGFPRMGLINSPNIPIYNADGSPYYDETGGLGYAANTVKSTYSNPAQLVAQGNFSGTKVDRLIASFYGELKPFRGLILKTQYGIDNAKVEDGEFWSPLHGDGYNNNGYATNASSRNKQWVWTNTASYDLLLNDHSFNFLLGTEATETTYSSWGIEKLDLTDVKFTDEQASFLTDNAVNDDLSSNSLVSYFGRLNYDYKAKYILSFNFRRDGYSGLGDKWGNFGGVAGAWRLSDEGFFKELRNVLDDVKIKSSWGVVGNTDVGSYPSKSYYSSYYYGDFSSYKLGQTADSKLKWETTQKFDLGTTFNLFKRISVELDYYKTKTKDLVLDVPQAPSKGIPGGSIKTNAGKMENSGFEVTVSADVIKTKDFSWNSSLNLTTNQNKVTALAEGVTEILGGDYSGLETTNITVVGKSIGQLYLYPTRGIDKETGRRIFVTPNNEEVLYKYEAGGFFYRDGTKYTGSIKQVLAGNTLPTYYGGWTNNFKYKNFDLSLFFQFSGGNKIYNGTKATTSDNRYWNNSIDVLNNYWTPDRKNATYALPVYGDNVSNGSKYAFTDWVENGDYVRLKNVVFGYTVNTKLLPKSVGISALRFYLQAQNLFVITKYTGLDPEALTNVRSYNLAGGTDKNTMPQSRVISLGVNLTF